MVTLFMSSRLTILYSLSENIVFFADKQVDVCSGVTTCCTPVTETYLMNKTHFQFRDRVFSKMRKLHLLFENITSTFDGTLFCNTGMNVDLWVDRGTCPPTY